MALILTAVQSNKQKIWVLKPGLSAFKMSGWEDSTWQRWGTGTLQESTRLQPVRRTLLSIHPPWSWNATEILHYLPLLSATTVMAIAQHQKKEGDSQRRMLAMLYTKDNDILQSYTVLQWRISLVFLSNRTQAAGSKYLLDLYQSMCHIYKVIFSLALGRKANAALDFCLQGLKSFTLDSCHPPLLTQDLSCTEECLFICCCCRTATERGRSCMVGGTDENNSQEIG